jgi:Protein of unknown function (DUF998)
VPASRCPIRALGSDVAGEGVTTTVHHTISPGSPSRVCLAAARAAIAATATASGLLLSLHLLSPEFSPAWRMVSEYANGQYGWVLSLMFAAYGTSTLALALAVGSHAATRRATSGLWLLVASGLGQLAAAAFDLNQEALHTLAGVLGIVCLPAGAMLLTPALTRSPRFARARTALLVAANLSWLTVVLWIASFVPMIVTLLQVVGSLPTTPPAELPRGVIALVGWTNRLMLLAAWAWVVTVAAVALHQEDGPASTSAAKFAPA